MQTETHAGLDASESAFARRALRRKPLFLALSVVGIAVALGLSGYYAWRRAHDPQFALAARAVIVVLVLLNARQNLRQYRYATVLGKVLPAGIGSGPAGPGLRT